MLSHIFPLNTQPKPRHLIIFIFPFRPAHTITINNIILSYSAILVGRDYPHPEGLEYVRRKWKEALRNPENYPGFVDVTVTVTDHGVEEGEEGAMSSLSSVRRSEEERKETIDEENERIIRKAVGRGRYVS